MNFFLLAVTICFVLLCLVVISRDILFGDKRLENVVRDWRSRRKQDESRRAELEAYRTKRNEIYRRMKVLAAIGLAALVSCQEATAQQTNNTPPSTNAPALPAKNNASGIYNFFKPLLQATNYAFEPYATYAPSAPKHIGGGVLGVYNLSEYVAPGVGVDYLGHFSLVSVSLTLRMPVHFSSFTSLPWLSNVTAVPFVLGGMGEPLSGTGGSAAPATIADTGAYIQFGHVFGGQFNVGAAYGKWFNAGAYSVDRYHLFAGWSIGF